MSKQPVTNYLKDYQTPDFLISSIYLTFELHPTETRVTNVMQVKRVKQEVSSLQLNGSEVSLVSVKINGESLSNKDYVLSSEYLTLPVETETAEIEIVTEIAPQDNTYLEGLYRTSGNYCTQCEAEGFRRITFYLDRPDVLASFTTKIVADKADNAVLLSNGNLIESGDLEGGKHYAVWHDPHLKPCYLFALVAGNLEKIEDSYITSEGRDVTLQIFVEPQNVDKCDHAMQSLKKSMAWDEQRFGLAYDLDVYMIVAVDDFNMGAMENKGLNVFNSKFVLARPETATDVDYEGIEAVIGHEYFHNWTGNRITCRDWFQLTLKEGLTVFRDQEFTADMLSPAVKRIEDVKRLRTFQFPEDSGPMSHPIQPQSYIEMNNFYTMTVYEKGAEVVRMYQTLLGREGFRRGMDLYIERHDGQAVTVQDFRQSMADANDVNLDQMHHWYTQSGTPVLKVTQAFDAEQGELILNFSQMVNGEQAHDELLIPLRLGLLTACGEVVLPEVSRSDFSVVAQQGELLVELNKMNGSIVLSGLDERPIVSFLRGFSAPVNLQAEQSMGDLAVLAEYDVDTFVRWESMQTLALKSLQQTVSDYQAGKSLCLLPEFAQAFKGMLSQSRGDMSLKALALSLPDLTYLAEQYAVQPVEALYEAYQFTLKALAEANQQTLLQTFQVLCSEEAYVYDKDAIAKRKLKNVCLGYLMALPEYVSLGVKQIENGNNMTDVLAGLQALSHTDTPERATCLSAFYDKWSHDPLVMDKWFAIQAGSHHLHALQHVKELVEHSDFKITNPNRVRSLLGVFGRNNLLGFHKEDGSGYAFMAEQIIRLNKVNPQVAARLLTPFTHWRKLDDQRQDYMKAELIRIKDTPNLSKDVFEIVSKSLL